MAAHPAYETFWKRKELLRKRRPAFPVRRWWETDGLSEIERIYFDAVREADSLLDVGAGDLRVMRKLRQAGFQREYHTQDIGEAGHYTYSDLSEVSRRYGGILCLDVLEHLPVENGLALVNRMIELLDRGGALVIQTPNAAYIPDPRSWDMTHVHTYNIQDLWAYLTCAGMEVTGYRVVLAPETRSWLEAGRAAVTSYVKRKILGCDYANNIALIARKPR